MPAGVGVNFVMEDGILPEKAEYLFFSTVPAAQQSTEWIVRDHQVFTEEFGAILQERYSVIYEDDFYIVYQKTDQ